MIIRDVIFPVLYSWAIITGWCAAFLIASAVALLLTNLVRYRNLGWWTTLFPLFALGVGIWSLVVAFNYYQQWLGITSHSPVHGLIAYEHAVDAIYRADIYRCQIQFAITALLLVLLVAGWGIFRALKHRRVDVNKT